MRIIPRVSGGEAGKTWAHTRRLLGHGEPEAEEATDGDVILEAMYLK
jgi:hypothetical protein